MSNPPKIVRVNDPASAFTLVAIAASILLLYSLSRIISLQRRVRDLESRPPVDDIVMRGMIRQQISDTFQMYERRRLEEETKNKPEIKTVKPEVKAEVKPEVKEVKAEVKLEVKEVTAQPEVKEVKEIKEIEILQESTEVKDIQNEYIADNEYEEAKIATKTIRKRSTKPKASV